MGSVYFVEIGGVCFLQAFEYVFEELLESHVFEHQHDFDFEVMHPFED